MIYISRCHAPVPLFVSPQNPGSLLGNDIYFFQPFSAATRGFLLTLSNRTLQSVLFKKTVFIKVFISKSCKVNHGLSYFINQLSFYNIYICLDRIMLIYVFFISYLILYLSILL